MLIAFIELKPARPISVTDASAPPAIIISASPRLIIHIDSPIECVPVEHAVTMPRFGPPAPQRIEILPLAMSLIIIGIRSGETREQPRSPSTFI